MVLALNKTEMLWSYFYLIRELSVGAHNALLYGIEGMKSFQEEVVEMSIRHGSGEVKKVV